MPGLNFHIVVTGHLAHAFARRCMSSTNWQVGDHQVRVTYRDDASPLDADRLGALEAIVRDHGGEFIRGTRRVFQLQSLDTMIRPGDPQDVVVLLDADDYLLPDALYTLSRVYEDPDVAMTYGSCLIDMDPFRDHDYFELGLSTTNSPIPADVWQQRSFRQDDFRCFHLRTFRRWLWQRVAPWRLRRADGSPIRASGDNAYTLAFLEMLDAPRHVRLVTEPLYVYRLHPQNVWRTARCDQVEDYHAIRAQPPCSPIPRDELGRLLGTSP